MPVTSVNSVKRIKSPSKKSDTLLLIDGDGILVCEKNDKENTISPKGYLEPDMFLNGIAAVIPFESGILPKDVLFYKKFYSKQGAILNHLFVFEFLPKVTNLSYKYRSLNIKTLEAGHIESAILQLSLPCIQFYTNIREIQGQVSTCGSWVSCTYDPITSLDDKIFMLPIHNISREDGRICWGTASNKAYDKSESIGNYARRTVNTFFGSVFNDHMYPMFPKEIAEELPADYPNYTYAKNTLLKWQEETMKNSEFYRNMTYHPHKDVKTIQNIIENIKKECGGNE